MGCISSKSICRSISIKQDTSYGFQSSASAWEELVASNGTKRHLFALLSSSKLTASFDLPPDQRFSISESEESGMGSRSFHTVEELDGLVESGWKRKAVGRGLKELDVEFPAFKQCVRLDSSASYVTPKFGSYNCDGGGGGGEESVFGPEVVAAFEECMQQLQEEEDTILREMDGR